MMDITGWNDDDKINFKRKLKDFCADTIKEKIEEARKSMARAQEAANDEEKNSMGDKYEISKVMGQIDSDRAGYQLFEGQKQLTLLHLVNVEGIYNEVKPGAFVICDEADYFIATSIGGKVIEGEKINLISALAPIAIQLNGKKAGDSISFQGKTLRIRQIF